MHEIFHKAASFRNLCAWLLAVGAFAVGVSDGPRALAAGCSYHSSSIQSDSLPEGMLRSYEYGQFRYYRPIESPCEGPNCGGSTPGGLEAPLVRTVNDPNDVMPLMPTGRFTTGRKPSRLDVGSSNLYALLPSHSLLRPPCA